MLEHYKKVLDERDPNTVGSMRALAMIWHKQGKYQEAEQLLSEALALMRDVFDGRHPYSVKMENQLDPWRNESDRGETKTSFVLGTVIGKVAQDGEHECLKFLRRRTNAVAHSRYYGSGFRYYGDF